MPEPVTPGKNPNKIMGLPKRVFWVVLVLALLLAYYLYRRNQTPAYDAPTATDLGVMPNQAGLTAADIGGTPSDNGTVYQPGDYTAQFDAVNSQIAGAEADLTSQIEGLSAAGVGTSTASAPQAPNVNVTVPIKVVKAGGAVKHHKARKHKRKKVHH